MAIAAMQKIQILCHNSRTAEILKILQGLQLVQLSGQEDLSRSS